MHLGNVAVRMRVASLLVLLLLPCAAANARQSRSNMQVHCEILPIVGLELNGQSPVYGSMTATVVTGPGELEVRGRTNDVSASQFLLTGASADAAVVNGMEIAPGQILELGHYSYNTPVVLQVSGTAPIRLTASRL